MTFIRRALLFSLAVVGGAVVASLAYGVQLGILVMLAEQVGSSSPGMWTVTALLSLFLALPAFLLGTAVVGAVVWKARGRAETISRLSAAIVGGASATLAGGLLLAVVLGPGALIVTAPLPLAGALGGMVFRWLLLKGLDRLRPPPVPPA